MQGHLLLLTLVKENAYFRLAHSTLCHSKQLPKLNNIVVSSVSLFPGLTLLYLPFFPTVIRFYLSLDALLFLVNTIAQAVRCCRHFVADHGAENLLPSNSQCSFHGSYTQFSTCQGAISPTLISLTPSHTNNNKSNVHLFYLTAMAVPLLRDFWLIQTEQYYMQLQWLCSVETFLEFALKDINKLI